MNKWTSERDGIEEVGECERGSGGGAASWHERMLLLMMILHPNDEYLYSLLCLSDTRRRRPSSSSLCTIHGDLRMRIENFLMLAILTLG